MPRKLRVMTTSFVSGSASTVAGNRAVACEYIGAGGADRADLVCLPENFLLCNVARSPREQAEELDGPTFTAFGRLARHHGVWVVGSWLVRQPDGGIGNCAVVIDRDGGLAGCYPKVHPTIGECTDITPGDTVTVVDTDFGRIGLAICFDIGWPDLWQELADGGAELVVWPSAYDGGFPLRAYAWLHQYYVVSSVRTTRSVVVDITGGVLAATSRWSRLATAEIDLEKKVFHIDEQVDKLYRLQRELGARVSVRAYSEENIFTVESHDRELPLPLLQERYGLETYTDYHRRSTSVQDQRRAGGSDGRVFP